jgi:radical SAM superfamily enzyme with C-terminal helix-hairpin-helix motif
MPLPRIEKAALATRDLDAALDRFLTDPEDESGQARMHTFADVAKTAPAGADVVRQHPGFPHVMAEIETARGCERTVHCTFCTEGLYPTCEYRPHDDIVAEVAALYAAGARHFRLGKQPNLLAWPGRRDGTGQVVPSPRDIEALYRDIRAAAPDLKTLHIDNVNPGFIASFPGPCSQIASIIAAANTPGDVAALGLESADPAVVAANHLKATAEDTLTAVRVLNAAGAHRDGRHLPALLPGLNLLLGLPGESARTYELDLDLLRRILDEGLLVRRINVRQVMAFPETPLHRLFAGKPPRIDKVRFHRFKQKVQEEIEQPMLQRVAPVGTLLPGVVTEFYDGDVTFGRQLASYPLLVGFPLKLPLRTVVTAMIVGHGFRSVTALPHPIDINGLPARALQALPGVGRPRARRLAEARPFATPAEAAAALDDPRVLAPFLDDIRTLVFPAPPT